METEEEFKPGDRVIGVGRGVIVAVTDSAGSAVPPQAPPYTYWVRYDNPELQKIGNSAGALAHRGASKLRLDEPPPQPGQFCPECEESDFFLADDYICACCRFALFELND